MSLGARWWWLSFADKSPPDGKGFLGVAVVRAESFVEAIKASLDFDALPAGYVNRLLTKAEAGELNRHFAQLKAQTPGAARSS